MIVYYIIVTPNICCDDRGQLDLYLHIHQCLSPLKDFLVDNVFNQDNVNIGVKYAVGLPKLNVDHHVG